jgi:linoleoyl-CoA desaturase
MANLKSIHKPHLSFKPTNASHQDFFPELRQKVNQYFKENKISPKANNAMVLKTTVLLVITIGCYGLIISNLLPKPLMWFLSFILGLGLAGIGFSIAHDALHGAYSDKKYINRLLGNTLNILGSSAYLWDMKHNQSHHTYTNVREYDEDIRAVALVRFSPFAPYYFFHRYQHIYTFFLYGLVYLHIALWHNFQQMFQADFGNYRHIIHPIKVWLELIFWKLVFVTWAFVIPLYFLDVTWLEFVIGFLTAALTTGWMLGLIFNLAHIVEETEFAEPSNQQELHNCWAIHQMQTTNNFAIQNSFLTWYLGGLNFQVEHHLFPNICSIHYPALSKIVQETAQKYDVPYHCHATFGDAIVSHYRKLKELGQAV